MKLQIVNSAGTTLFFITEREARGGHWSLMQVRSSGTVEVDSYSTKKSAEERIFRVFMELSERRPGLALVRG